MKLSSAISATVLLTVLLPGCGADVPTDGPAGTPDSAPATQPGATPTTQPTLAPSKPTSQAVVAVIGRNHEHGESKIIWHHDLFRLQEQLMLLARDADRTSMQVLRVDYGSSSRLWTAPKPILPGNVQLLDDTPLGRTSNRVVRAFADARTELASFPETFTNRAILLGTHWRVSNTQREELIQQVSGFLQTDGTHVCIVDGWAVGEGFDELAAELVKMFPKRVHRQPPKAAPASASPDLLVLLDTSGSMIETLDYAKRDAYRDLAKLNSKQRLLILAMAAKEPEAVPSKEFVPAARENLLAAETKLREIVSKGRTHPISMIEAAKTAVSTLPDDGTPLRIVLASDLNFEDPARVIRAMAQLAGIRKGTSVEILIYRDKVYPAQMEFVESLKDRHTNTTVEQIRSRPN